MCWGLGWWLVDGWSVKGTVWICVQASLCHMCRWVSCGSVSICAFKVGWCVAFCAVVGFWVVGWVLCSTWFDYMMLDELIYHIVFIYTLWSGRTLKHVSLSKVSLFACVGWWEFCCWKIFQISQNISNFYNAISTHQKIDRKTMYSSYVLVNYFVYIMNLPCWLHLYFVIYIIECRCKTYVEDISVLFLIEYALVVV